MDINDKIKVYTEIFHLIDMKEISEFIEYYDIWALRDAIKISPLLLSSTKKYVPDKDREKKDNKISDICREIIHLFEMDDVNKFIKKYTIWGLRHALKIMPLILRYTNQIDISSEKGKEIVDENLSDIYKEINIFLKNKKIMIFIDKFGIAGLKHTLEINHLLSKYTQNLNISSNRDKEQDDGYYLMIVLIIYLIIVLMIILMIILIYLIIVLMITLMINLMIAPENVLN